ncbi:MAG TPA: ATP-binding protein [Lachnospiraceae bacterium]|nr:ATP-binding protein [uncultured Lachnoclostridium sp.]HAU84451.1 ATP-binding protein [Lachnospiraceae bacterium]
MLLSYSVKNFKSIKEECTFSLIPGRKMKRFENNVITSESGIRGLKSAVIVGENGGGKTNFIQSLDFLKFLFNSAEEIKTMRSLLHYDDAKKKSTQEFRVSVCLERIIYDYTLILDGTSIKEERLDVGISESKKMNVFSIYRSDFKDVGKKIEIKFEWEMDARLIDEQKIKSDAVQNSNRLFILKLELLDVEVVKPFCDWMRNKLIVHSPSNISYAKFLEIQKQEEDLEILQDERFIEIFQLVDPSIIKLKIDEEEPFKDSIVIRRSENGKEYRTRMSKESSGIRDFFAWSIDIWRVIYDDCTVFADEMDKVLNPLLSERVVTLIHGSEHKGQFVFSTHNVLHMNTINFMKQQLWITTRNKEDMSTNLYSLAEYKDFRYDRTNIYELYLSGLLGGTIDG